MAECASIDDFNLLHKKFSRFENNNNQNGTHAFRYYVKYFSKTKYFIISPAEYQHYLYLEKTYGLNFNIKLSPWHWGVLISEGEWSIFFNYTSQNFTHFYDIGKVKNIPLQNNIFKYSTQPILIRNNALINYIEITNDLNTLPRDLIDNSAWDIVLNSNHALNQIWREIIWKSNQIIEFKNGRFVITENWDGFNYIKFYQKMGDIVNNDKELKRQLTKIITGAGYGNRRILL